MMQNGREVYEAGYRAGWRPEPRLTVSAWADEHRVLGNRAGHAAVRWHTDLTPYLREIMDALGPRSAARRIVFMKGSQLGGTEAGNNWLGYIMHHCPGPILVLRPTVEEARRFSRQRLDPMIATTPVLTELVTEARARDGGNSLLTKEFPGGVLFLTGSNSATGVKSMPIRWLFCDEIDEYPGDVDQQGDPIALAEKRTTGPTYSRRKVFLVSTPTVKGISRIEREFLSSDRRRYFVPCPHCGKLDWMRWENIRWTDADPKTAELLCVACGALIEERFKPQMLARGEWRATAEGNGETIGFHLSSLYSPLGWLPWSAAVAEFLEAKENPMRLKNWVNSVLGESWEVRGTSQDVGSLRARNGGNGLERYELPEGVTVPAGVGLLVVSVDVQTDRLEVQLVGWGAQEESWLLRHWQLWGNPRGETADPSGAPSVWMRLDGILSTAWRHVGGRDLRVECCVIDSGGFDPEFVYRYCAARIGQRVFAIKGGPVRGTTLISKPTTNNRFRAPLFMVSNDAASETVMGRMQVQTPGPGYMHLPEWTTDEYLEQLTAEKGIPVWNRHSGTRFEWRKDPAARNEAWDLWKYATAALYVLDYLSMASGEGSVIRRLPELAAYWGTAPEILPPEEEPVPPRPRRTSWALGGLPW